jgi:nucleotide-binding universal stress UspA family protein
MAAKNLLIFPTDFSERSLSALPWVRKMAETMQADVRCIYVVEEPQIYSTLDMGPIAIPSVTELVRNAETRIDSFIKANLKAFGSAPKASVLVGRPAEEIANYARDHGAAMIIMTTHGYSGVKHLLLGSTTEGVLRHASCPVLSIRTA